MKFIDVLVTGSLYTCNEKFNRIDEQESNV